MDVLLLVAHLECEVALAAVDNCVGAIIKPCEGAVVPIAVY